jgi:hypothetical protein
MEGEKTIIRPATTPLQEVERLSNEGYDVNLNAARKGRLRLPLRPQDVERGRGKRWACGITFGPCATDVVNGFGELASEAIEDAVEQLGDRPAHFGAGLPS